MMSLVGGIGKIAAKGHIQLILGPMFSGKTTELIRRIRRFQVANHSCLMIKYSKDDRYSKEDISTHDKLITRATSCSELKTISDQAKSFGVIGIDEGQFFPDIVEFCEEMANKGKMVIVAALDGTFQRKPFGSIMDLVPLAESVIKLKAVCMVCYGDAAFTKRLGQETEIEVIGGAEKYMSVCRSCYNVHEMNSQITPTRQPPVLNTNSGRNRELFPTDS
jgi:thymidine kinase